MNRYWSLLFWTVPICGTAVYALSLLDIWPMQSTWLPENVSTSGKIIDDLFNLIHIICAAIFLMTTTVLAYSLWRYRTTPERKASPVHSHTWVEIVWSIIPAVILIFLSLYQYDSWADNTMRRPMITVNGIDQHQPPSALIVAKQFGWEVYYPGMDGKLGTIDDVYVENELYVPADEDVVLQLESRDVIHSLFVPVLRLKQDIVPGMTHFCWFRAVGADPKKNYEFACTELCGWGHYKMKGWLRIVSRSEYDQIMATMNAGRMQTADPNVDEPNVDEPNVDEPNVDEPGADENSGDSNIE